MSEFRGEATTGSDGTAVIARGMAGRPLWEKLIMTVLLTVGVGPLIGTTIVSLPGMAIGLVPLEMMQRNLLLVVLLGYVFGGLQALICGLTCAVYGWQSGRLPVWIPIVTALPLAFLFKLIVSGMSGGGLLSSVIIHIVPALATWWLVRPYWQRATA